MGKFEKTLNSMHHIRNNNDNTETISNFQIICIVCFKEFKMLENNQSWLDKNVPEDVRLYVFIIFKVALLIFSHNHITISDYSEDFSGMHVWLKRVYISEMIIHLVVISIVNIVLIFDFRDFY